MLGGLEVNAIVLDPGSSTIKAGYSGEDNPRTIYSSNCGYYDLSIPLVSSNPFHQRVSTQYSYLYDTELDPYYNNKQILQSIHNGLVMDTDIFQGILETIFATQLFSDPSKHPILMSEPFFNTKPRREASLQLFFEHFSTNHFIPMHDAVLDCFSVGKPAGLSINMGSGKTSVVAVSDGRAILRSAQTTKSGPGDSLDNLLYHLTLKSHNLIDLPLPYQVDKVALTAAEYGPTKNTNCLNGSSIGNNSSLPQSSHGSLIGSNLQCDIIPSVDMGWGDDNDDDSTYPYDLFTATSSSRNGNTSSVPNTPSAAMGSSSLPSSSSIIMSDGTKKISNKTLKRILRILRSSSTPLTYTAIQYYINLVQSWIYQNPHTLQTSLLSSIPSTRAIHIAESEHISHVVHVGVGGNGSNTQNSLNHTNKPMLLSGSSYAACSVARYKAYCHLFRSRLEGLVQSSLSSRSSSHLGCSQASLLRLQRAMHRLSHPHTIPQHLSLSSSSRTHNNRTNNPTNNDHTTNKTKQSSKNDNIQLDYFYGSPAYHRTAVEKQRELLGSLGESLFSSSSSDDTIQRSSILSSSQDHRQPPSTSSSSSYTLPSMVAPSSTYSHIIPSVTNQGSHIIARYNTHKSTQSYHSYQLQRLLRDIKHHCITVPLSPYNPTQVDQRSIQYTLPDGIILELGHIGILCGESLFNPVLQLGSEVVCDINPNKRYTSLHKLVYDCIMESDVDLRVSLMSNMILSGGPSAIPGLSQRLTVELQSIFPAGFTIATTPVLTKAERQYGTWIGGSILSGLTAFHPSWISRSEYLEYGNNILLRKAL